MDKNEEYCIITEIYHQSSSDDFPISYEYGNFDYSNYVGSCGQEYHNQTSIDWLIGKHCHKCGKTTKLGEKLDRSKWVQFKI